MICIICLVIWLMVYGFKLLKFWKKLCKIFIEGKIKIVRVRLCNIGMSFCFFLLSEVNRGELIYIINVKILFKISINCKIFWIR